MHYVIGDIHNELHKLISIFEQIELSPNDELIVLGDVFDRGADKPDPVGVYFELCKIQGKCIWVRAPPQGHIVPVAGVGLICCASAFRCRREAWAASGVR